MVVLVLTSSIATGHALRAYSSGTPHLHRPPFALPMIGHRPLRLSPWEQVWRRGQLELQHPGSHQQEPLRSGVSATGTATTGTSDTGVSAIGAAVAPSTRPTGAMGLGIRFHLRLPAGLAGGHLGPSGQGDPHQVQTLMEAGPVELLTHDNSSPALSSLVKLPRPSRWRPVA